MKSEYRDYFERAGWKLYAICYSDGSAAFTLTLTDQVIDIRASFENLTNGKIRFLHQASMEFDNHGKVLRHITQEHYLAVFSTRHPIPFIDMKKNKSIEQIVQEGTKKLKYWAKRVSAVRDFGLRNGRRFDDDLLMPSAISANVEPIQAQLTKLQN